MGIVFDYLSEDEKQLKERMRIVVMRRLSHICSAVQDYKIKIAKERMLENYMKLLHKPMIDKSYDKNK